MMLRGDSVEDRKLLPLSRDTMPRDPTSSPRLESVPGRLVSELGPRLVSVPRRLVSEPWNRLVSMRKLRLVSTPGSMLTLLLVVLWLLPVGNEEEPEISMLELTTMLSDSRRDAMLSGGTTDPVRAREGRSVGGGEVSSY
jgi:hypothetical protein